MNTQTRANDTIAPHDDVVLSPRKVCEKLDWSRSTLDRQRHRGQFPEPIQLSPGRVGWKLSTVVAWLSEREAAAL